MYLPHRVAKTPAHVRRVCPQSCTQHTFIHGCIVRHACVHSPAGKKRLGRVTFASTCRDNDKLKHPEPHIEKHVMCREQINPFDMAHMYMQCAGRDNCCRKSLCVARGAKERRSPSTPPRTKPRPFCLFAFCSAYHKHVEIRNMYSYVYRRRNTNRMYTYTHRDAATQHTKTHVCTSVCMYEYICTEGYASIYMCDI